MRHVDAPAADPGVSLFDMTLRAELGGHDLELALEYATTLWTSGSAERFVRSLTNLLRAGLAAPDRSLREVPILDDEERDTIVRRWNETAGDLPPVTVDRLVDPTFEPWVDRDAVVCGPHRLAHGELWDRAGRLAAHLRERGVGPEVLVGVHAERSVDTVVAILGVLRAGGATCRSIPCRRRRAGPGSWPAATSPSSWAPRRARR